jgi:hypothetical protein
MRGAMHGGGFAGGSEWPTKQERRDESRRGTQECVRHAGGAMQSDRLAGGRGWPTRCGGGAMQSDGLAGGSEWPTIHKHQGGETRVWG